jgi:PhnB protein
LFSLHQEIEMTNPSTETTASSAAGPSTQTSSRASTQTSAAPAAPGPLTPYIVVRGAAQAIDFYCSVFGAREDFRLTEPDGKIGHAELLIGESRLMLAEEYPDFGALGPGAVGGTPVTLHLYVPDVDATVARAEEAGATVLGKVKLEFYGDRRGQLLDPFGHRWHIATQVETVSPEEMQTRWTRMLAG